MAEGFFYWVRALVDKQSFEEGKKELDKLASASTGIIKGLAGVSAALVGTATAAGLVAQQELKLSNAIGVSSEAMTSFKIACGMAGVASSGLLNTLSSLDSKMQHLKTGTVDTGLAKTLGMLGIGYTEFADMDSQERMKAVYAQASKMKDQSVAAEMVGDVLGSAGKEYYQSLQMSGKTLSQQLKEAQQLNFVSTRNRKEGAAFATEIQGIKEAGKSITMLLGTEIASKLTPLAQQIKRFIITNRANIIQGIHGIAETVGVLAKGIIGTIGAVAPIVSGLIDTFGGLDTILIRIGIAFTALKFSQIASSIVGLVKSVNLLKAGFSGLVSGLGITALFLILDDFMTYKRGGESAIGWLLDNIDELKKKFKDFIGEENYDNIVKGFNSLADALQRLKNILPDIGKLWKENLIDIASNIKDSLSELVKWLKESIEWAAGLVKAFSKGGIEGALEYQGAYKKKKDEGKNAFVEERWAETLQAAGIKDKSSIRTDLVKALDERFEQEYRAEFDPLFKAKQSAGKAVKGAGNLIFDTAGKIADAILGRDTTWTTEYLKTLLNLQTTNKADAQKARAEYEIKAGLKEAAVQEKQNERLAPEREAQRKAAEANARAMQEAAEREKEAAEKRKQGIDGEKKGGFLNAVKGFFTGKKVDDGIISPTGRVIGISPNDWVFAMKDLDNLTSALVPSMYGQQAVNAESNYVINQSFTVNGNANAEIIRESAYNGTSQALRENLVNANRILQYMPGTR